MKAGSIALCIALGLFIILVGYEVYVFRGVRTQVSQELNDLQVKVQAARMDQVKLQEELQYYKAPENLEKELRARFPYRRPDEKLIIIVPKNGTTTPQ